MMGNYHVRCGAGEKSEVVTPETYLSLFGSLPDFQEKLATMRKYEISCTIILQNLSQLKKMYEKDYEAIVGNCDSLLFLGTDEPSTCEYISKKLGKTTIRDISTSATRGKGSTNYSYKTKARELLMPDEIRTLDNTDCIYFLRGEFPFFGKKFDLEKHRNYCFTGDADFKNNYKFKVPPKKLFVSSSSVAGSVAGTEDNNGENLKDTENNNNINNNGKENNNTEKTTSNSNIGEVVVDDPSANIQNHKKDTKTTYKDCGTSSTQELIEDFKMISSSALMISFSYEDDVDDDNDDLEGEYTENFYPASEAVV